MPCHIKFLPTGNSCQFSRPKPKSRQGPPSLFFTAPIGLPSPNAARSDLPRGTLSFRLYFQTARNFALHVAALSNAFPFDLFHALPARFFRLARETFSLCDRPKQFGLSLSLLLYRKALSLKSCHGRTFFRLIPYRRKCPYAISFAIRQGCFLSLLFLCALKNLPAPRVPKGMRPLKIKITSFHSLSHSIVPKMLPVLSAESALYYVQYSRNEPPFCKPYARRRFPFHTDKSPRYSFCFFLSVLNLFKKKIFLFSHNIQPRSKRFANVFATSQFFPKPFSFSLLPPD